MRKGAIFNIARLQGSETSFELPHLKLSEALRFSNLICQRAEIAKVSLITRAAPQLLNLIPKLRGFDCGLSLWVIPIDQPWRSGTSKADCAKELQLQKLSCKSARNLKPSSERNCRHLGIRCSSANHKIKGEPQLQPKHVALWNFRRESLMTSI